MPASAAETVDLLLVLASDVSRSVDHPKFLLQREAGDQLGGDRRRRDGAQIRRSRGRGAALFRRPTSISGGIDFALAQFNRAPFEAPRRTIDVSGDGTNNAGREHQVGIRIGRGHC
jgi:hypothetical protein